MCREPCEPHGRKYSYFRRKTTRIYLELHINVVWLFCVMGSLKMTMIEGFNNQYSKNGVDGALLKMPYTLLGAARTSRSSRGFQKTM